LNVPGDLYGEDWGGDCLRCRAEAGDPDALAAAWKTEERIRLANARLVASYATDNLNLRETVRQLENELSAARRAAIKTEPHPSDSLRIKALVARLSIFSASSRISLQAIERLLAKQGVTDDHVVAEERAIAKEARAKAAEITVDENGEVPGWVIAWNNLQRKQIADVE
jgi:hypothetical protein